MTFLQPGDCIVVDGAPATVVCLWPDRVLAKVRDGFGRVRSVMARDCEPVVEEMEEAST